MMLSRHAASLLALCLAMAAFSARAATIRVPTDQLTIQAGIDAAAVGDTVLVAAGTYTGTGNVDLNPGGRDIVVRSESGPEETIIDCQGSPAADVRGFIFQSGETRDAVVRGFTIRNGYRSGDIYPGGYGGGMLITGPSTSPTVEDCVFENNHTEGFGGGMASGDGASPAITNCLFRDNSAGVFAGGLQVGFGEIVGCRFVNNSSTERGGAVSCSGGAPVFRDCSIIGNSSAAGGGVTCSFTTATFENCLIEGNTASPWPGGGIHGDFLADVILTGCVLRGNVSEGSAQAGGAAASLSGSISLTGCTLYANSSASGNGIAVGDGAVATIANSIIAFGLQGEAVACFGSGSATLTCSDLFGNAGGDWTGCIAGQGGASGNLAADPLFCNVGIGDLHLAASSPCAPAQSGACGLIGALDVSCTSAVTPSTWGAIKADFRR